MSRLLSSRTATWARYSTQNPDRHTTVPIVVESIAVITKTLLSVAQGFDIGISKRIEVAGGLALQKRYNLARIGNSGNWIEQCRIDPTENRGVCADAPRGSGWRWPQTLALSRSSAGCGAGLARKRSSAHLRGNIRTIQRVSLPIRIPLQIIAGAALSTPGFPIARRCPLVGHVFGGIEHPNLNTLATRNM